MSAYRLIQKFLIVYALSFLLISHAFAQGNSWTPNRSSRDDQTLLVMIAAQRHPRLAWLDAFGVNPFTVLSRVSEAASLLGNQAQSTHISDSPVTWFEYLEDVAPDLETEKRHLALTQEILLQHLQIIEYIFEDGLGDTYADDVTIVNNQISRLRKIQQKPAFLTNNYTLAIKQAYYSLFPLLRDGQGQSRLSKTDVSGAFASLRTKIKNITPKDLTDLYRGSEAYRMLSEGGGGKGPSYTWLAKHIVSVDQEHITYALNSFVMQKIVPATMRWSSYKKSHTPSVVAAVDVEPLSALRSFWGGDCSSKTLAEYGLIQGAKTYLLLSKTSRKGTSSTSEAGYLFSMDIELEGQQIPYFMASNGPYMNRKMYLASTWMLNETGKGDSVLVPDIRHNPYATDNIEIKELLEEFAAIGESVVAPLPAAWTDILDPRSLELKKQYSEIHDPAYLTKSIQHAIKISRTQLQQKINDRFGTRISAAPTTEFYPSLYRSGAQLKSLPWLSVGLILQWGGSREVIKQESRLTDAELDAALKLAEAQKLNQAIEPANAKSIIDSLKLKLSDLTKLNVNVRTSLLEEIHATSARLYSKGDWKAALEMTMNLMLKNKVVNHDLIKLARSENLPIPEDLDCNGIYE